MGGFSENKSPFPAAEVEGETPKKCNGFFPGRGIEFGRKPLFPYKEILTLSDWGKHNFSFTEVETAKLFVQLPTDVTHPPGQEKDRTDEVLDKLSIISNTMPLNTKVAVGNRPPFHTYVGVLKEEMPLPEFSKELNGYLDAIRAAGAEGVEKFPLMITMDTPGKIELVDFTLVYDREAIAKWGDSNRQTLNFDRQGVQNITLKFPTTSSNDWRIHSICLDVIPEFPPWRSFPRDTQDPADKILARVGSDLNIAQCLFIEETTELYGLGIFVSAHDEKSDILIEIQQDKQGAPDNMPFLKKLSQPFCHG